VRLRLTSFVFTVIAISLLSDCSRTWSSYRHNGERTGHQNYHSRLSDPDDVTKLAVGWVWPSSGSEGGLFKASPVVFEDKVFIGSSSGFFYALDEKSGNKLWQFPPGPALTGSCLNFGAYGIQASATRARIKGEEAVLFGAPDPAAESGLGSARLWALSAKTGKQIWASDVVAHINGCSVYPAPKSLGELHERIAYSSPLVHEDKVYIGVHDSGDDPIQNGKVIAVDLQTGKVVPGFSYVSTSTRGGGVWNAPASDGKGVYFTTGNTRTWGSGGSQPAPAINNGLSLLRIDPASGAITWKFQPVPYPLDFDPDWSAGAAVMDSSCGELIESVQKDGWTYALNANDGSCKWQYPPTNEPTCKFPVPAGCPPACPTNHNDTDYKQPGAVWGDVLVIKGGGWGLILPYPGGVPAGYTRLHALNSCGSDLQRVRWIVDFPPTTATPADGYSIGAPTVTGGIVYVPTDHGHVVAIADPSVRPPAGFQCTFEFINPTNTGPTWAAVCTAMGFQVVPTPQILADVALPDGANASGLRNEAAIANGRLYVGTQGGHVCALWPK
jgi:outer membrane protein assembly factor BamB